MTLFYQQPFQLSSSGKLSTLVLRNLHWSQARVAHFVDV
jgi:hypothetical protein